MTNRPVMLPFEPGRQPFCRGWWWAGVLVVPFSAWTSTGVVALSGLGTGTPRARLLVAGCLAVLAVVAFVLLTALQQWECRRRSDLYARDRLPSLQSAAALDAYAAGDFDGVEEAWRSVETEAMAFFDEEMTVVREVYRNYHRLCWLPVQHAALVPACMAVYSLAHGVVSLVS